MMCCVLFQSCNIQEYLVNCWWCRGRVWGQTPRVHRQIRGHLLQWKVRVFLPRMCVPTRNTCLAVSETGTICAEWLVSRGLTGRSASNVGPHAKSTNTDLKERGYSLSLLPTTGTNFYCLCPCPHNSMLDGFLCSHIPSMPCYEWLIGQVMEF